MHNFSKHRITHETPSWLIIELFDKNDAVNYGRREWCTGREESYHYEDTYSVAHGRLYVLYKKDKARPQYQLFLPHRNSNSFYMEFRDGGNKHTDRSEFLQKWKELRPIFVSLGVKEETYEERARRTDGLSNIDAHIRAQVQAIANVVSDSLDTMLVPSSSTPNQRPDPSAAYSQWGAPLATPNALRASMSSRPVSWTFDSEYCNPDDIRSMLEHDEFHIPIECLAYRIIEQPQYMSVDSMYGGHVGFHMVTSPATVGIDWRETIDNYYIHLRTNGNTQSLNYRFVHRSRELPFEARVGVLAFVRDVNSLLVFTGRRWLDLEHDLLNAMIRAMHPQGTWRNRA